LRPLGARRSTTTASGSSGRPSGLRSRCSEGPTGPKRGAGPALSQISFLVVAYLSTARRAVSAGGIVIFPRAEARGLKTAPSRLWRLARDNIADLLVNLLRWLGSTAEDLGAKPARSHIGLSRCRSQDQSGTAWLASSQAHSWFCVRRRGEQPLSRIGRVTSNAVVHATFSAALDALLKSMRSPAHAPLRP
jgi:hypothetical protein